EHRTLRSRPRGVFVVARLAFQGIGAMRRVDLVLASDVLALTDARGDAVPAPRSGGHAALQAYFTAVTPLARAQPRVHAVAIAERAGEAQEPGGVSVVPERLQGRQPQGAGSADGERHGALDE